MVDTIHTVACIALLTMFLPVATVMHHRGFWTQRVALWILTISLGLMAISPLWQVMPPVSAIQAMFMSMLAIVVFWMRRQIMAAVRLAVGSEAADSEHPYRRARDIEDELELSKVHGGVRAP